MAEFGTWLKNLWLWTLGPTMLILLLLMAPDVPSAWAARHGNGQPGTWTLTSSNCHGSNCRTWGDFTPDTGGPTRHHIRLSGSDTPLEGIGLQRRAIDVKAWKNKVFVLGGGRAYSAVWISAILLIGSTFWAVTLIVVSRRARAARPPA